MSDSEKQGESDHRERERERGGKKRQGHVTIREKQGCFFLFIVNYYL
jgi:hypothetical protein